MSRQRPADELTVGALHGKGFRVTSQRIAISQYALRSREHPTAQKVFREVKKAYPGLSLATVYNTLQVLRKLHLVQELAFSQKKENRYDSYVKPHINVVCLRCGHVKDVNDRSAREIVSRAAAKSKLTITEQRFDIYGICTKCKITSKGPSK